MTQTTSKREHECPPLIRRPDVPARVAAALSKIDELIQVETKRLELLQATEQALSVLKRHPERLADPLIRGALKAGWAFVGEHYAPDLSNEPGSPEYAIDKVGERLGEHIGVLAGEQIDIGEGGTMSAYYVAVEIADSFRFHGVCPECAEVHATGRLKYAESPA